MPSPLADRPGLLIRDPFRYTDTTLIVPPVLVRCLHLYDGLHSELDVREELVRLTGELAVSEVVSQLTEALSGAGFLHDERGEQLRELRHREFVEAEFRQATHAGSAYPDEHEALRKTMHRYMGAEPESASTDSLVAIAAPHVSPEGGWRSYQAAYRALAPAYRDRTFVILGTSHYGEPDRFGLTRKSFSTPMGTAITDTRLVDRLAASAPNAVIMEDYCHSFEHSIEFQIIFLQHLFGADIRVVPILCGSFGKSIGARQLPEKDDGVRRFLDALGEMGSVEDGRLLWVLGVDMAHIGPRYGDEFPATTGEGKMLEVEQRDAQRIQQVNTGNAEGFWELVCENEDDLKWCGSAPIYTFLRAVPDARGELLHYDQWNIDQQSVVTFAGMSFRRAEPLPHGHGSETEPRA